MKKLLIISFLIIASLPTFAQYEESSAVFRVLTSSTAKFGDYNQDGYLDIVSSGWDVAEKKRYAILYENNNGKDFSINTQTSLKGVNDVTPNNAAWGDLNNDNQIDLIIAGQDGGQRTATIYVGSGQRLLNFATLTGVFASSVSWTDYNGDGWQDILITGINTKHVDVSEIFQNNQGGSFAPSSVKLEGVFDGTSVWGDMDKDGDADLLVTGKSAHGQLVSLVYENLGNGIFKNLELNLVPLRRASAAWGDYDNDGYLDFLISGFNVKEHPTTQLYHNNGNKTFSPVKTIITDLSSSAIAWGDVDNNGELDVLVSGEDVNHTKATKVYLNNKGNFTDANYGIIGVDMGGMDLGDINNDGKLDMIVTGQNQQFKGVTTLYLNKCSKTNTAPNSPEGLTVKKEGNQITLSWQEAADAGDADTQTPSKALTYNIRIGTKSNGTEVVSPLADLKTGKRFVVEMGNVGHTTSYTITLPKGTYYWSVQTIDNGYMGSNFSTEQIFTVE